MQPSDSEQNVAGHVKWFDATKGFGFVVPDDGGSDILLHANVLRNFGQGSVADGAAIEIEVQTTDRGLQAVRILNIIAMTEDVPPLRDMAEYSQEDISSVEVVPSRVKWFDKAKGFGFANVFGNDQDVFVHVDVLRRSGLANLQAGEAVGLRVIDGERGRMAIDVVTWDNVAT